MSTQHSTKYYWKHDSQVFGSVGSEHFDPHYWQQRNAVTGKEHGRGTTWFLQHQQYALVLRHYLRGGMIGKIIRDRYLYTRREACRSIAEFHVLQQLRAMQLPVPRPIAAQVIRHKCWYRADLIIERIPEAQDLLKVLQSPQNDAFYQKLAHTVAQFHQQQVYHADLNIQNVLYDSQGKFWLIDFDRATVGQATPAQQTTSIKRLQRSFEKEKGRHGIQWTSDDWTCFEQAYRDARMAP